MSLLGGLLGGLLGKVDVGDLFVKVLLGKATIAEMKRAKVGDVVEIPTLRTKMLGGYWSVPLGPATKIDD